MIRLRLALHGPVACFSTAALCFTVSQEGGIFRKMLQIPRIHNIIQEWVTFAVIVAASHQEALRAQTLIKQGGMFAYVSHGFPCWATREQNFCRTGLCDIILYQLWGKLFIIQT